MRKRSLERSKVISLRLKPAEHRYLLAEAEKMYVPLSAFIRHRLFGREILPSRKLGTDIAGRKVVQHVKSAKVGHGR